jgi:hypothetical protein
VGGSTFALVGASGDAYWGTAFNQTLTGTWEIVAPAPLPATLPLFATGLAALALFGWRRKRTGKTGRPHGRPVTGQNHFL